MFNFNAKQLMIIYPAYHSGAYVRGCFMLHDDVADDRYKSSPNKITRFSELLYNQHPKRREFSKVYGCPNAHFDRAALRPEDLNSFSHCDYYTHSGHKQSYNWHNNEEDYPVQDEQTQIIFNNMVMINILPDCDVHPTRAELASDPLWADGLYKFSRDNEIWYMTKYNIPNVYLNYSVIINPDINILLDEVLRIADLFKWPMADSDTLLEYMKLYHETVLHISPVTI